MLKIGEKVVVLMFSEAGRPLIVEPADSEQGAFAQILIFLLCGFTMDNLVVNVPHTMDFAPKKAV